MKPILKGRVNSVCEVTCRNRLAFNGLCLDGRYPNRSAAFLINYTFDRTDVTEEGTAVHFSPQRIGLNDL